jgi:hypothetical protein
MQFAERWLGIGSIVVALAAVGTVGFQLRPRHHHHHHDEMVRRHIDFQPSNCSGAAASTTVTVDQALLENRPDPYEAVLVQADVAGCFTTSDRVEMLIDIAADGHVTRATHRPEQPTHESRCIAKVARGLVFPATGESLAIRYAFTH